MNKVLIIEDDLVIAEAIAKHLSKWKYEAKYVTDFENINEEFISFDPHLILLDISLPFMNGYHWCSEIRKISKVPIIFLSSANENLNVVMAMNMGGDDFIAKPFDMNVLTAKIGALIRRAYSFGGQLNVIEYKGAILNLSDASLLYREQKIELTKNEFKILQILMENPDKVVPRDALMIKLWEDESFIDDNTLTVNVTRLRKKLDSLGLENFISTKKGIGYIV